MKQRTFIRSLLGGLILILSSVTVVSQGQIIRPDFQWSSLDLVEHRVMAEIQENISIVSVEHVFENTGSRTVEGHFLFPLPKGAEVSDFSMDIDGEPMKGELLSADEARRIYEAIVAKNIDPALLERMDDRTFKARVFPIPPKQKRKITLRYEAVLAREGNQVRFSYPFQGKLTHRAQGPITRERPRDVMLGGGPGPDRAPKSTNHFLLIDIKSASGLTGIYSPSHKVSTQRPNSKTAKIEFESSDLQNQDLSLYFSIEQTELGASMFTHRPVKDENGYFLMLLSPPVEVDETEVLPKDIVFVLDTSGSMRGKKMEQAREALGYCIQRLGPKDRYGIIGFSSDARPYKAGLTGGANIDGALNFVSNLEPAGGTNIDDALGRALAMLDDAKDASIIFLTDGLPTSGERSESAIRANVKSENSSNARIFSFGVGHDVNTRLLDGLSRSSGGFADYIEPGENIEERIGAFYDKIRYPVMKNLAVTYSGVKTLEVSPREISDLYKGGQILVTGRYEEGGKGHVIVKGDVRGDTREFRIPVSFAESNREQDFVSRLWGARRIGDLLEDIRAGEDKELIDEVVRLSKQFGIVTPYTSYLVQEDDVAFREGAPRLNEVVVSGGARAMEAESGREAVKVSKAIRSYQTQAQTEKQRSQGRSMIVIQGRELRQESGVWADAAYADDDKIIEIPFGSQSFFSALKLFPDLVKFAQLGEGVLFGYNGKYLRFGSAGLETQSDSEIRKLIG